MISEIGPYSDGEPFFELVYPLATGDAFKTVNGAVFYTLSRRSPLRPVPRDESAGAVVYPILGQGVVAQLFVLHINEHTVALRLHPVVPDDPTERIAWFHQTGPRASEQFAPLMRQCHETIVTMLRRSVNIEDTKPPMPPKSDLDAILIWQEIYYPDMTNEELAERCGRQHQSIRNARNRKRRPKRIEPKKLERK